MTEVSESKARYPFKFTGNGAAYFKIWIVNTLLTIVTFTLYAPWAKVRKYRYLYGNTYLDDHSFDYTANPIQLLKGRLIGMALFMIYLGASYYSLSLSIIVAFILMALSPILIYFSLRFNARYSEYRGQNFNFKGTVADSFIVNFGYVFISILTLGILFPLALKKLHHYIYNNHSYGGKSFEFVAKTSTYYKIFFIAWLILMSTIVVGILLAQFYSSFDMTNIDLGSKNNMIFTVILYASFILPGILMSGLLYRLIFNSISVENDSHQFKCDLSLWRWVYIGTTNLMLLVITLGFYMPWATVRVAKYKAQCTSVYGTTLNDFIAQAQNEEDATATEISDVFDMDISV